MGAARADDGIRWPASDVSIAPQRPSRRRHAPGWVPNQHGAWAMLATPLLVGALASGLSWVHLPLAAFWFVGYFAFFATSLWLKSRRRARYWPPVRTYAFATVVLGGITLVAQPALMVWAPLFAPPLAAGLWAAAQRRDREVAAGLLTVLGSVVMTAVAYAAGPGDDLRSAWLLALVLLLYFGGTIFYVKSAIRERGNLRFRSLSVGIHLLATVPVALVSPWLAVVFIVLTLRALVVPSLSPTPQAMGIGEIVATVAVATISLAVV